MEIKLRNLKRNYGSLHAVDGVSLDIPSNTVYGIIGRSGAGKSTLVRLVSMLEKPDTGEVYYDDKRVDNLSKEELMQETYVRVKQNIRSYREGNFSAWLLMIARNLAYNHVRRAKRETPLPENPPEREYRMEEGGTPVLDAVKAVLGEEEGQIVVLHAVGGYKHREIAKMLNKPLGTVTWTYKNALEKLRKYLEEEGKR